MLANIITPLRNLDYSGQILMKKNWSKSLLNTIKTKHLPRFRTTLHGVIPSPRTTAYRNKDEFSVQIGVDGNPKTVGLFVGSGSEGEVISVFPSGLENIREDHLEVAKVFEEFIRQSSLNACHRLNDGGCWRSIQVRSNRQGEIMATVIAHPAGIPEGEIDSIKENLVKHFQTKVTSLKSLYLQLCPHTRCNHQQAPYSLIYGNPYIFESIDSYTFRISPESYIQNNTDSIPLLYERIFDFIDVNKQYTILDLNCGIGAFSIFASSYVRGCIGIENSTLCVEDANCNAVKNNVKNCHFMYGSLEKELKGILKELDSTPYIIAVVNAGNIGLHDQVVKILRRCVQLKKLVLFTGKADHPNAMRTIINFCRPKFDTSTPFYLSNVQPIDMYPGTKYCDLIMLFQRAK
ncbi:tRNA (uracil-5-)-methyltransferase homolog B-like isoform X2 [Rhodnius prolixus]